MSSHSLVQQDDRYARTSEWLDILNGAWTQDNFSYAGKYYRVDTNLLQPKPVSRPRPVIYAGGESEAAKQRIAEKCDAYVMHGDSPEKIQARIADLSQRRGRLKLPPVEIGGARDTRAGETRQGALRQSA